MNGDVMSKKKKTDCGDCRYQMSGFDGGFFGLPVTCECKIFGETENRENCRKFEKKITREYLFEKIRQLEKENEQLRKQIHNIGYAIEKAVSDLRRTEEVYLADFDIVKRISEYEKELKSE